MRTAINHQEPDRVPLDYWASPEITAALMERLGVTEYESLLEKLGVDIRYVFPPYIGPNLRQFPDRSREDIWQVRRDPVHNEVSYAPLHQAEKLQDLDNFPWPDPDWYDYSQIPELCEEHRDCSVVVCSERTNRTSVLHQGIYLCGMEKMMTDLLLNPEFVHRMFERITGFYLEVNRRIFESGRKKIDIILIGDDLGTQESLLLSPGMLKEFVFPYLKKHFSLAHDYGIKVMLHSCGAIREIIPDLIDLGVDILNPIQVRARGMVPEELKKEFGNKLTFHGSLDIQKTLPFGSVKDVKEEVMERIKVLAPGGGFILAPTHNFQPGTPLENVLALYDTALQTGQYRK